MKRPGGGQLRVIKGGGDASRKKGDGRWRPANLLLLILALFLLAQVLLGWIWGSFNRNAGRVVLAGEGSVDISLSTGGILTFEEELVFAPQSGFVHYHVKEGERVPAGKELAVITTFPRETPEAATAKEPEGDYLQRFRNWLLEDRGSAVQPTADILFPHNREWEITAPRSGLISLRIDGWEMFGPESSYVYLDEEEYRKKGPDMQVLSSGEKVSRFNPVLRIINNYKWYYSTVMPAVPGKLIAEEARIKLLFSFAPEQPVWAEKVEAREREEGKVEVTWSIEQAAGDFYNHRWCTAEIVYDCLEGVFIPKNTLLDADGKKGVYVVEKGVIVLREVVVLAEKDDYFLVKNLNPYERVIVRPGRVKEGQRLLW
ncbi:MAG: HlyD family efflux transporter periplasmic adaptor subunit [Bacillota bacterium]